MDDKKGIWKYFKTLVRPLWQLQLRTLIQIMEVPTNSIFPNTNISPTPPLSLLI